MYENRKVKTENKESTFMNRRLSVILPLPAPSKTRKNNRYTKRLNGKHGPLKMKL